MPERGRASTYHHPTPTRPVAPADERRATSAEATPGASYGVVESVLELQRSAGNAAVSSALGLLQRAPGAPAEIEMPEMYLGHDRPADVLEAIVHMMSNRGVTVDTEGGVVVSTPRYATEVKKTVREPEHVALIWEWWRLSVEDAVDEKQIHSIAKGSMARTRIARAAGETAPLLAAARADKKGDGAHWADLYAAGLEELSQRAAREEVEEMTDAGVDAASKPPSVPGSDDEDGRIREGAAEGESMIWELGELFHRLSERFSSSEVHEATEHAVKASYDKQLAVYLDEVFQKDNIWADAPELQHLHKAAGMNVPDGLALLKGGLDAVSVIMTATDPQARADLFKKHGSYFGNVAQGAQVNKVMWQFVSGVIGFGGGIVYAMARVAGKAALAEGALEATVKGVGTVAGPLFLVGVIHGTATLLDPDATPDEKAQGAVEAVSGAVGVAGFAARWTPRLAIAARWSGPIALSLTINFEVFKSLAHLRQGAEIGMNRLDWVTCVQETEAAATEVQAWMRRLAVTEAILANESDDRRKEELTKNAAAFADELIEQQLKPFVDAKLADKDGCPPAFLRRLAPMTGLIGNAKGSEDAALVAAATFLGIVEKALTEWDEIIMEKD